jgi:CubicO group peptidase (beta-lactamase class C family)
MAFSLRAALQTSVTYTVEPFARDVVIVDGIIETLPAMSQRYGSLSTSLEQEDCRVRSFIVMRDGERMFEHYRHDVTPHTLEEVNSVTKSVVALAVGIAQDEGLLPDLDTPASAFIPDARDDRVTLRHLLTMTSGFEWDASAIDDCVLGACERFSAPEERLHFILSRPFSHAPGETFVYDSHAVHLLSHVIENATGRTLARYAEEKLFAPAGIEKYEWISDEAGHSFAARGLTLSTRDMAKLGELVRLRGRANDARIVSERFIDEATTSHLEGGPPMAPADYGYLWWIAPRYVFAAGYGGQFIFVARDSRTVAAATSDYEEASRHARALFERHVLD